MTRWTALALSAQLTTLVAVAAELHIKVFDENGPAWARLEVYGPDGRKRQPPEAVFDPRSQQMAEAPGYRSSFVVHARCRINVDPGRYRVIAERGLEYERVERIVEVGQGNQRVDMTLQRWVLARARGWWSGDMHVHRPLDQMAALAMAEDINLSAVLTIWNQQNYWADKSLPKNRVLRVSPHHQVTFLNAEDERGGGAWMLHQVPEPPPIGAARRWYPPGIRFVRAARSSRAADQLFPWFEVEKLIWWEAPVMIALEPPDSVGLLHNHFQQFGMLDSEAWGRRRDQGQFPGKQGFVEYSNQLYYRYLNLGFRWPVTAGSASGVLPNPVGYNRVYVPLPGRFTVENWFAALREGKSFVTNGPMLFWSVQESDGIAKGSVEVLAREPIDRVEIIANGRIVAKMTAPPAAKKWKGSFAVNVGNHSWIAARCFLKNPDTVRMAHSSPISVSGKWDSRADAAYFVRWIDELIEVTQADSKRFADVGERDEVLQLYREARSFYAGRMANGRE